MRKLFLTKITDLWHAQLQHVFIPTAMPRVHPSSLKKIDFTHSRGQRLCDWEFFSFVFMFRDTVCSLSMKCSLRVNKGKQTAYRNSLVFFHENLHYKQ